jgi:hypothetical protein
VFAESATEFSAGHERNEDIPTDSPEWVVRRLGELRAIEELKTLVARVEAGLVPLNDSFLPDFVPSELERLERIATLLATVVACVVTLLPFFWFGELAGYAIATAQITVCLFLRHRRGGDAWTFSWCFGVVSGALLALIS